MKLIVPVFEAKAGHDPEKYLKSPGYLASVQRMKQSIMNAEDDRIFAEMDKITALATPICGYESHAQFGQPLHTCEEKECIVREVLER